MLPPIVNTIAQKPRNSNGHIVGRPPFKFVVETIPQYDGNLHTLTIFINNAESLLNSINNDALKPIILSAIIAKLAGRALMLIGSSSDLASWEDFKKPSVSETKKISIVLV